MREVQIIPGSRPGGSPAPFLFRPYRYNGSVPLDKDPEIHKSIKHGTASAARLHYLRGEKRCDACTESERERWRRGAANRKARKEAAAKEAAA